MNISMKSIYNHTKVHFHLNFLAHHVFDNIYWYYYLRVPMKKMNMSDQYVKKMEKSSLNISFKELTMNENNHVY